jgi:hypothetical protein
MALQFSVEVRNARLDAIETAIGASPILRLRTGTVPASTATGDAGTVLAEMTLPADWMAAASGGSKLKAGTWNDPAANAAGIAGHFRIYTSGGTCYAQGTVTITGGGGDMEVDNTNVAVGQDITVTTFTINDPNG